MTSWDPADPPPIRVGLRDVLVFIIGLTLVVTLVVLVLAGGQG